MSMLSNLMQYTEDNFKKKLFIWFCATVSFLFMIFLIILVFIEDKSNNIDYIPYIPAAYALAIITLLSYHTTLSLDNFAKDDATLSKDVIRNALTATFIVMYVVYFSFSISGAFLEDGNIDQQTLENFTNNLTSLTKVVIAFYFGSSAAIEMMKVFKDRTG